MQALDPTVLADQRFGFATTRAARELLVIFNTAAIQDQSRLDAVGLREHAVRTSGPWGTRRHNPRHSSERLVEHVNDGGQ